MLSHRLGAFQEATAELLAALEPLLESEGWAAGPAVYSSPKGGGVTDFGSTHSQDTVLLYRPAVLALESAELHGCARSRC